MSNSFWNVLNKKLPEGVSLLEIPGAGKPVDFLSELMNKKAPLKETPATQKIAGMGENEKTVQKLLATFLGGGGDVTQSDPYKLGMGELNKTLGGEFYDPRTSDFWKGFREQSQAEQVEGTENIRRRGQLGGGLFSTGVAREETKYQAGKESERTSMLGGLYEKERDRKTNAVGQALGYAELGERNTISRLELGSTIGSIPRDIQNQKYQAAYNTAQQKSENQYNKELFPYNAQAGIAKELMPQWLVGDNGELDMDKMMGQVTQLMNKMNK